MNRFFIIFILFMFSFVYANTHTPTEIRGVVTEKAIVQDCGGDVCTREFQLTVDKKTYVFDNSLGREDWDKIVQGKLYILKLIGGKVVKVELALTLGESL